MRIAYADPPYIGQARKHYGEAEIDHDALILDLSSYDGWALSCSSPTLYRILHSCYCIGVLPRVGAWVKPFAIFKPNVNPAYAWEPVVFVPARKRGREEPTIRDWVSANITLKKGLSGVKPEAFCWWLFDVLQMERSDEFVDLFPGSGAVTRAWEAWRCSTGPPAPNESV